MHPAEQRFCDQILEHPFMQTPEQEPEPPPSPRRRRPRVFHYPPKWPLLSDHFYLIWTNHMKELALAKKKIDNEPPVLFPEMYLKPRRIDLATKLLTHTLKFNRELLQKINLIQRSRGYVDCWNSKSSYKLCKLLCEFRQRRVDAIENVNVSMHSRLKRVRSKWPTAKQYDEMWIKTKHNIEAGSQFPFILFNTDTIDKGFQDPTLDKPPNVYRPQVLLEVVVVGGCKIGTVLVELFSDVAPRTCDLFLTLVRGDPRGYAYTGTRIFRIVPDLFCCCGDVAKDCGYGTFIQEGEEFAPQPENFHFRHTVPGILSMIVNPGNEVNGQFNIIFKPMDQLDGNHVVFGRVRIKCCKNSKVAACRPKFL